MDRDVYFYRYYTQWCKRLVHRGLDPGFRVVSCLRVRPRFRLPNGKGSRLFLLPFRLVVVRSRCIVLFLPWHASISTHGRPYGALEPRASKEEETPLRCVARARRLARSVPSYLPIQRCPAARIHTLLFQQLPMLFSSLLHR